MKLKNFSLDFHTKLARSRFHTKTNKLRSRRGLDSSRLLGYCYDDIELVEEEQDYNSVSKCEANLIDSEKIRIKSRIL